MRFTYIWRSPKANHRASPAALDGGGGTAHLLRQQRGQLSHGLVGHLPHHFPGSPALRQGNRPIRSARPFEVEAASVGDGGPRAADEGEPPPEGRRAGHGYRHQPGIRRLPRDEGQPFLGGKEAPVLAARPFRRDHRHVAVAQDGPGGLKRRPIDDAARDVHDAIVVQQPCDQGPAAHLDLRQRDGIARQLGTDDHRIEPVDVIVEDDPRAGLRHPIRARHLDAQKHAEQKSQDRAENAPAERRARGRRSLTMALGGRIWHRGLHLTPAWRCDAACVHAKVRLLPRPSRNERRAGAACASDRSRA